MKLVIDISEGDYKSACKREFSMDGSMLIYNAIREGTEYKERPHGVWKEVCDFDGNHYKWECSVCDRLEEFEEDFCNCGADMRKEGETE